MLQLQRMDKLSPNTQWLRTGKNLHKNLSGAAHCVCYEMQIPDSAKRMPIIRQLQELALFCLTAPLVVFGEEDLGHPPANTFSIVAIDSETGEMGIAVQSKIVAVGAVCAFASADAGVVATQAYANMNYGPMGLQLLRIGLAPDQAIELMTEHDPLKEKRQVAVIDPQGRVSAFTGKECNDWAGQKTGDGYSVQGNLLVGEEVLTEMAKAFEETEGVLAERLIAAMRAGQAAGGDKRGKQSAALIVVKEGWGYGGTSDRLRDIRVDDHEAPIEELARVYKLHREMFKRRDEAARKRAAEESQEKEKKEEE
ncbi:MAG: DUF1028 domain-containing protein [Verrucomicrobiota bacterium]